MRAVADPVAMRQAENVLCAPLEGLIAHTTLAHALDDDANAVARRPMRNGLHARVDLAHVPVEQSYRRSTGHWIDVADSARSVLGGRRSAQRRTRILPWIAEHWRIRVGCVRYLGNDVR